MPFYQYHSLIAFHESRKSICNLFLHLNRSKLKRITETNRLRLIYLLENRQ